MLYARAGAVLVPLLLAAVAASPACGTGGAGNAGGDAASARDVFRRHCATCHGEDGEGRQLSPLRAPSFKSDFVVKLTDEQLYKWMADGGGNMPSYKNTLTEEQMRALVKHVRELQSKPYSGVHTCATPPWERGHPCPPKRAASTLEVEALTLKC
ncbi:MAG TPA: cytochrome c [Pyrinomonadaceae bacterium]|nr:cytochrome c [Pyrinomonadaceae bacterium]